MSESITVSLTPQEYAAMYEAASNAPPLLAVMLLDVLPAPEVANRAVISPDAANCPSTGRSITTAIKWIAILVAVYYGGKFLT